MILFVQHLAGSLKQAKVLSMARITKAIGLENCLSTRPVAYGTELFLLLTQFTIQFVEKFIPAFERAHGPGFQALVMVDNSQGHSVYAADALLTLRMNMWPGGKQAFMCNGWFVHNGQKVSQEMNFQACQKG